MINRFCLLLFLCTSYVSWSQVSDKFELTDVFNLEYVSEPQISPDGQRIAYVRNFKDIMTDKNLSNIWMINFDGSNNRPLTTGNQSDFHPRWSPDGQKLIYKSNKDGSVQVYLRWLGESSESKLTNSNETPGNISWSPDNKYLAYIMFVPKSPAPFLNLPKKPKGAEWNDPPKVVDKLKFRSDGRGWDKDGNQQLFILSLDGGTPRQLTDNFYNHGSPQWTPDGNSLVFSANHYEDGAYDPNNSEVHKISIATSKITTLTSRQGPDNNPIVSPDGSKIAYIGFDDIYDGYEVRRLYTMNSDGSSSKLISKNLDRDVQGIAWSSDNRGIYFQYDDQGDTKIAYTDLNGKVNDLTNRVGGLSLGRPYSGGSFSVSRNGRYAYTYASTQSPADLAAGEKTKAGKLTSLNDDLFSYKKLGTVEEIWYESSFDKRKIQGWICKPPNFDPNKKYPLILEIHGGPFTNYGSRFSAEIQLYAAAGYVVLYTNPRGSTSYGKEFGNLIHHNYPSQDYDDLMSGVDAMIEKGYIDSDKLYVTGGSGGGVLTSWIIGKTDRFKAAVVAKPVINWYSFVLYADNPGFFSKYWFPSFPWEDPEHYHNRSPISLVGNVSTPTMLLTGEADMRTPIVETEQYYAALKLRKIEAVMVRIPGAYHGIAAQPSNLIAKVAYIVEWFDSHK